MNEEWTRRGVATYLAIICVLVPTTLAGLLTWADRRHSAMIQDRIGPDRAVIWVPGKAAASTLLFFALLVVISAVAWTSQVEFPQSCRWYVALFITELAILFTWGTALAIGGRIRVRGTRSAFDVAVRSLGEPRVFVWSGLSLQVVTFVAALMTKGVSGGVLFEKVGLSFAPIVLAFDVAFGALYIALRLAAEKRVGVRFSGLLHPIADGIKLVFKEDVIPDASDRLVHSLAPIISLFPVLVAMAVIPLGDNLCFGSNGSIDAWHAPGNQVCYGPVLSLQLVELDAGLLFFFVFNGFGIISALLAGWASNSKYSLLGGLRAASQTVSCEVTKGLSLIGLIEIYGTLRIDQMVWWQAQNAWGLFVQPTAFVLFFVASVAESKRLPFDLPEGKSELVAGYLTEYSGLKFAMFYFSEYVSLATSSALLVALFFGGWSIPFVDRDGLRVIIGGTEWLSVALPQIVVVSLGVGAFVGKWLFLCWIQLLIRWSLPRFRYDQLMTLGWQKLVPLSLVNIVVTATIVMTIESLGGATTDKALTLLGQLTESVSVVIGLVGFVVLGLFLMKPVRYEKLVASSSASSPVASTGAVSGGTGV